MSLTALINIQLPYIDATSSIDKTIDEMDLHKVEHVALLDEDRQLVAVVSYDEVLEVSGIKELFEHYKHLQTIQYAYNHQHIFSAVQKLMQHQISILPILDQHQKYLGSVGALQLFQSVLGASNLLLPGGIIVLEMLSEEYSLSEITRICESNNAHIVHLQVYTPPETNRMLVTIKLNTLSINYITETFERFNYQIKEAYGDMSNQNFIIERYKNLMHYINL